jgi:hypothetical protein
MCNHNRLAFFAGLASLRLCVKCFAFFQFFHSFGRPWHDDLGGPGGLIILEGRPPYLSRIQ